MGLPKGFAFPLDGRVVLVTGGASGIGRATALMALAGGAKVAAVDINQDAIDTAVREVLAADPEIILVSKTPVTRALVRATRTIPIVFVTVVDPVGSG